MKQKLVNFFESASLTWFVPITKLVFGEEPAEQMKEIVRMLGLPAVALALFFLTWSFMSTRIKTSVGQLPSPGYTWSQAKAMWFNHKSESQAKVEFEDLENRRQAIEALLTERRAHEESGNTAGIKSTTQAVADFLETTRKKHASYTPLIDKYTSIHESAQQKKKNKIDKLTATFIARKAFQYDKTGEPLLDAYGKPKLTKDAITKLNSLNYYRVAVLEGNLAGVYQKYADKFKSLIGKVEKIEGYVSDTAQLSALPVTPEIEKKLKVLNKKRTAFEKQLSRGNEYNGNGSIVDYIKLSIITVLFGFFLAAIVAIPLGILCGLSPLFMTSINPIIQVFKPVSPLAWVLITIQVIDGIFVGDKTLTGDIIKNTFLHAGITVALCSLWATLSNTALGVSAVDPDHLNVAKVLKLGWFDRVFKIIIPSAVPYIFTGLRITLGVGWMVLIVSEMMATSRGLGWFIDQEYQNNKVESLANIIVCIFIIGIIGFVLDRIMYTLQKLVSFSDEVSA